MIIGMREFNKLSSNDKNKLMNLQKELYLNSDLCQGEITTKLNIHLNVYRHINKINNWKRDTKHEYRVQCRIRKIKYGYENPFQNVEHMKHKFQEKLGVDNPFQSEEVKEKLNKPI